MSWRGTSTECVQGLDSGLLVLTAAEYTERGDKWAANMALVGKKEGAYTRMKRRRWIPRGVHFWGGEILVQAATVCTAIGNPGSR